jgi:hypothetical protein
LDVGKEGIFFLQADSANAWCRQIEDALPIEKSSLRFEDARKVVAAVVKVHADPVAALSADKARDRQFAAVALVARYRTGRPTPDAKTHVDEPIPAAESRLILGVLAGMKWNDPALDADGIISLPSAFRQLQLSEKDGWQQPQPKADENPDDVMGKAVAEWFKNHAAEYRIQRRIVRETEARQKR